ncbi:MAG: hypothetical protein LBR79_01205 [Oscillospiraceae bacterium]|nr:hypothetical protein [Oscillospiraceae bacterium]
MKFLLSPPPAYGGEERYYQLIWATPRFCKYYIVDLFVNFTDCNQNRRRHIKILQGDFDAKPFF